MRSVKGSLPSNSSIVHILVKGITASPTYFLICQGVSEGEVLSVLFVDELLDNYSYYPIVKFETTVQGLYYGSPMYVHFLALVSGSPVELQAMLNIFAAYGSGGTTTMQ